MKLPYHPHDKIIQLFLNQEKLPGKKWKINWEAMGTALDAWAQEKDKGKGRERAVFPKWA